MAQAIVIDSKPFTAEQAFDWLAKRSPRIETTMAELARQWNRDGDAGRIWASRHIEHWDDEGLITRELTRDRRSIIHVHEDVRRDSPFYDIDLNTRFVIDVPQVADVRRTSWRTLVNIYVIGAMFVAVLFGALAGYAMSAVERPNITSERACDTPNKVAVR